MPPKKSAIGRLFDMFHTHPKGRLYEFFFFASIGSVLVALAIVGAPPRLDWFAEPISWLIGIVGACLVIFSLLPQKKRRAPPPLPPGKRGEIAAKVKASKAERKKKGPPPPGPPIRRG